MGKLGRDYPPDRLTSTHSRDHSPGGQALSHSQLKRGEIWDGPARPAPRRSPV